MSTAIDATVVRHPMSGVHYAVRHQALALLTEFSEDHPTLLATDPFLRSCWNTLELPCPPLRNRLRKAVWRISWQQTRLPGLLRRLDCDRLLALSYTAPLRCPIPYVLQVHDTIGLRAPNLCSRQNALHMRTLMPRSMMKAEKIIVPSTQVADEVLGFTKRNATDILVVPLGVDEVFLSENAGETLPEDWKAFRPYILFVGNIEPKKGIDTLLAAYKKLPEAKDYTLVVAGQPAWKCNWLIQEMDKYTGPGRIVRLGYIERSDMPAIYRHAAAYVQPSTEEGFGLPILEALAMGTPLIHSDHPVVVETSGGFGQSFPVGHADQLAGALSEMLQNPVADRVAAGQNWARTRTWENWAQTLNKMTRLFG